MSTQTTAGVPVQQSTTIAGIERARRLIGPASLVLGPFLGGIGMILHVPGSDDDNALAADITTHAGRWIASHLTLTFGWALLAVGLASASRLARGRGRHLSAIGSVVGTIGAFFMAVADGTHGVVVYALSGQVSPARSIAIQTAYFDHRIIGVLMMAAMLLPLGVLVLGLGMLRSGAMPRWAAAVLMTSPIAIQAAGAAGPWEALGTAPLLIGCAALARVLADF